MLSKKFILDRVTPCMGVWIEILHVNNKKIPCPQSLPVWECGLKFYIVLRQTHH